MDCLILILVQENSNQVPEVTGIGYDGQVTNSAGDFSACTVRDCTVELATLQLPRYRHSRDLVKTTTPLRLATSPDVTPVVSASGEAGDSVCVGEEGGDVSECEGADEPMDLSGRSDDSDVDPGYLPPRHPLSSDSDSDAGASFSTSRKVKAGRWRLRLAPAKVSKLGRRAAKVS